MVLCSLSVGSLLLNAASGTPEHLDQSIGLSQLYFPHCPHPRDVCDNQSEHMSPKVVGARARRGCFGEVLAAPGAAELVLLLSQQWVLGPAGL